MSTTIAIDLGGTNIRAARIEGYEIKQKIAVKCKANGQKHDVVQQLFDLVRQLMTPETEKIGIGVPSIIDHEKGVVRQHNKAIDSIISFFFIVSWFVFLFYVQFIYNREAPKRPQSSSVEKWTWICSISFG